MTQLAELPGLARVTPFTMKTVKAGDRVPVE